MLEEIKENEATVEEEYTAEEASLQESVIDQETTHYYVSDASLPELEMTDDQPKKSYKGLIIFIVCAVLVILAVVVGMVIASLQEKKGLSGKDEDGDEASSITDIYKVEQETSIPRCKPDAGIQLRIMTERGEELSAQEVYEMVNPSTVLVVAEKENTTSAAIGTGIVMTQDGYILTNAHVIAGANACWIATDIGETYDCELAGYDSDADIAVLRAVDAIDLIPATFGNSDDVMVGEKAYAIGNPLGIELRGTLTDGIISAVNRTISLDGRTITVLQTNAALNSGNSGGPLINSYGQVIGINTLKMSERKTNEATIEGLGFALPISTMSFIVNDIIQYGEYLGTPTMGILVTTVRVEGSVCACIVGVEDGFGAKEAGLQEGDIIVAADDQPIKVTSDLLTVRRNHRVNEEITLTIKRDDDVFDVKVLLKPSK